MFTVTGLKTNTKYRFFVIARNVFGTSLPSSVVTVNVSKEAWDGTRIEGLPSSPHAIDITQTGADYLTLSWTAPTISHHQDEHKYKSVAEGIYYLSSFFNCLNTPIETFYSISFLANFLTMLLKKACVHFSVTTIEFFTFYFPDCTTASLLTLPRTLWSPWRPRPPACS